jgi:hypothetical protein
MSFPYVLFHKIKSETRCHSLQFDKYVNWVMMNVNGNNSEIIALNLFEICLKQ